ncbi:MAG: hypothetical protein EXS05_12830 [Planctomycetaceae bacterium]|nr:hypothetical protein [Planctomycetaceae bacterium]
MAKKSSPRLPPSPEAREELLRVIQSTAAPLTATELVKLLVPPHQIAAKDLTPILDEYVAAGRLHKLPLATKTGKPRYWDRDAPAMSRAAAMEAVQGTDAPLTAAELAKRMVAPLKVTDSELTRLLEEHVAAGTLNLFPPKTLKSKPRYWNRDPIEFARLAILQTLAAKGPQTAAKLKLSAKGLADDQFEQIVTGLIATQQLWRQPPVGKAGKELFGGSPPSPEPYLRNVGIELTKVVSQLLAANVPKEDVRRSLVQLIEGAGITLGSAMPPGDDAHRAPPRSDGIDLIALMRRIEPGADRGALVGSRELRRVAKLEKTRFDRAALELARDGRLSLHRHDYPASLTAAERDELVTDGDGTYYIGMAIRQSTG